MKRSDGALFSSLLSGISAVQAQWVRREVAKAVEYRQAVRKEATFNIQDMDIKVGLNKSRPFYAKLGKLS